MKNDHLVLSEIIDNLNISQELKNQCHNCGFKILDDILKHDIDELINKYDFTMHAVVEIVDIIEEKGIKDLVKNWD